MPGNVVTVKDLESDEAVWALYALWCKAYGKERDHVQMARRFHEFKKSALDVHQWNVSFKTDYMQLDKFADGEDGKEERGAPFAEMMDEGAKSICAASIGNVPETTCPALPTTEDDVQKTR
ncbi:hypothetical protein QOZ80_2BG0163100 [Eleusine coracana subsp. coracana]|nr:hypothetical protein QOZ80_2BG0163100 [Eleusine coracana subsp. coracana]